MINKHGNNGNIEESESIFNRMPHKNVITHTSMLTAYAKNGQIAKAKKLFDEMPERTTATYNAMITAYIRNSCMVDEAFSLFSRMSERNAVSYGAMITGFLKAGMFEKAENLYREIPAKWREPVCSNAMISGYLKVGRLEEAIKVFEGTVEKDVVSWSSMVDGYCKKGRIFEARELFNMMPVRNVVTWTSMIDGYMNVGFFENGFSLFLSMRRVIEVNPLTLTIMFEACRHFGRYREAMQVHGLVLRIGFEFDIFLGNSIIAMYCEFGCMDEAKRMFQMMNNKDVVSWNSLISGYIQHDEIEEAYKLFEKIPGKDVVSWTTMITGFSAKGNVQKGIQLFKIMPEKDDVAWTAVISGFVSNGEYEEAFLWFIEMLKKAVKPNSLTFSSMLTASASLATLNQGLQIHAHVEKMDVQFDLSIRNSLVSMYSKCGNIAEAYQVFTSINAPNIISFNSMITGFSQNGHGEEALDLFSKMRKENQEPNEITFLDYLEKRFCLFGICAGGSRNVTNGEEKAIAAYSGIFQVPYKDQLKSEFDFVPIPIPVFGLLLVIRAIKTLRAMKLCYSICNLRVSQIKDDRGDEYLVDNVLNKTAGIMKAYDSNTFLGNLLVDPKFIKEIIVNQ
ncbi:pentatricopeptide repeat-containing protein, putative [Ricinus communis]|uniref:Pentatricopeptide repeat-containing protein, putative n=1 Tax=Ricinus communis TaxID=3988 RepID=B9SZK3_RICCO|nr:pentatricopeptide repeat-containing protein, putative [Ricinus communis]